MNEFNKRSILVTGCSSGIGKHCASRLATDGWRVFATARDKSDIESLRQDGLEALYLDYADENSIHAAFQFVMAQTGGKLDALFNNGAYAQGGAVEDVSTETLRAQFEANFFGWHTLTQLVVPVMRQMGHGRIVQCSSILGVIPFRWRGAYVSSKYAIEGLFHTQQLELRGSGIHLCLIQPGPIRTKIGLNGIAYFKDNIDIENSIHAPTYARYLENLSDQDAVGVFRKSPELVYRALQHALTARKPRACYPLTPPTWFMFAMRRLLNRSALDWIVTRTN